MKAFIMNDTVKVYASTKQPFSSIGNQGDLFNYNLSRLFFNENFLRVGVNDKNLIDEKTFCFVGSVLQWLPSARKMILYGPGFIDYQKTSSNLNGNIVLGVRGYLSEEIYRSCYKKSVQIVSDPGLLLSCVVDQMFYDDGGLLNVQKEEVGFIIHSVDRKTFFDSNPELKPHLVDNYSDLKSFVRKLRKYKRIATTSLHGAIFAHSLGIEVGVFFHSGKIIGEKFKFFDYYSSLGMDVDIISSSVIGNGLNDYKSFVDSFPQPSKLHLKKLKEKMFFDINLIVDEFVG